MKKTVLKKGSKWNKNKQYHIDDMKELFLEIWMKKPHVSEISGKKIYGEPKSIYFHHILPKSIYPLAALDEENIIILTFEEHQKVENNPNLYSIINEKRKFLFIKYGIKTNISK